MGHRHSKDEMLEAALSTAFEVGLSRVTYGRVATRLGISDRIVVYYFPTKADLIAEVLTALGARLQAALGPAFAETAPDHRELLRTAWPILTAADADAVFALYFEAAGLAASGREPYATLVPRLVTGWMEWAADLIDGPLDVRRREAAAAIAVIDGLLLVRQLVGPDAAGRAAAQIVERSP